MVSCFSVTCGVNFKSASLKTGFPCHVKMVTKNYMTLALGVCPATNFSFTGKIQVIAIRSCCLFQAFASASSFLFN